VLKSLTAIDLNRRRMSGTAYDSEEQAAKQLGDLHSTSGEQLRYRRSVPATAFAADGNHVSLEALPPGPCLRAEAHSPYERHWTPSPDMVR